MKARTQHYDSNVLKLIEVAVNVTHTPPIRVYNYKAYNRQDMFLQCLTRANMGGECRLLEASIPFLSLQVKGWIANLNSNRTKGLSRLSTL